jgi:hypothetical protein
MPARHASDSKRQQGTYLSVARSRAGDYRDSAMDDQPVARWRDQAADARAAADELTDPEAKLLLLTIAQTYEHLARRAEERAAKKDREYAK